MKKHFSFAKFLSAIAFAATINVFFITSLALAANKKSDSLIALELSPNRLVHLQISQANSPSKPTFLMLPGVNRSLLMSEPLAQLLAKRGYGVAIMNFSTQPFSINLLEAGTQPFFKTKKFEISDFVFEVETVITYLKQQHNVSYVIPVSLSFSAAVSPFLKSAEAVIEIAPLTSTAAANPVLAQTIRNLKAGELFNPFFGPGITRSTLDSIYRNEWKSAVDVQIKTYQLQSVHKENMVEGYTTMSRSVEVFDWEKVKLTNKIKRIFILAKNESKSLLKNQAQTILNILNQDIPSSVYLIENSGHIIPSDQPESLATAITHSVGEGLAAGEMAEVGEKSKKLNVLNLSESQIRLKEMSK